VRKQQPPDARRIEARGMDAIQRPLCVQAHSRVNERGLSTTVHQVHMTVQWMA
jgi:hypothetical protein